MEAERRRNWAACNSCTGCRGSGRQSAGWSPAARTAQRVHRVAAALPSTPEGRDSRLKSLVLALVLVRTRWRAAILADAPAELIRPSLLAAAGRQG
jgi:hypothetical protein